MRPLNSAAEGLKLDAGFLPAGFSIESTGEGVGEEEPSPASARPAVGSGEVAFVFDEFDVASAAAVGVAAGFRVAPALSACLLCSKSCRKRSEEHTSELQSLAYLVCRLLLEKKKK